jgi:YidC/Oxa1 family membrane protein insertase
MLAFFNPFVDLAYHLVCALATGLAGLPLGLAPTVAIIVFTVAVRLAVLPLSYHAMRGQAAQARVAPQLQELRRRYASQPDRLRTEMTAVYQREGTGMLAGCLPALLQAPFFTVMYVLFRSAAVDGHPNTLLSHDLFGAPLASHWLSGAGPLSTQGAVFAVIFALLALAGWLQHRQAASQPGGAIAAVARLMPYLTVVIAAFVPLAAGLYLVTTTAWTLAERAILRRRINGQAPAPSQ